MSFATAVAEIQAQLVNEVGVVEYGDPRVDSLVNAQGGKLDGAYLLKFRTVGEPWIEAEVTPTHWHSKCTLEICVLIKNDEVTDSATLAGYARLAHRYLLHTSLAEGCVFDSQQPRIIRNGNDRRMVWQWQFSLRYTES